MIARAGISSRTRASSSVIPSRSRAYSRSSEPSSATTWAASTGSAAARASRALVRSEAPTPQRAARHHIPAAIRARPGAASSTGLDLVVVIWHGASRSSEDRQVDQAAGQTEDRPVQEQQPLVLLGGRAQQLGEVAGAPWRGSVR